MIEGKKYYNKVSWERFRIDLRSYFYASIVFTVVLMFVAGLSKDNPLAKESFLMIVEVGILTCLICFIFPLATLIPFGYIKNLFKNGYWISFEKDYFKIDYLFHFSTYKYTDIWEIEAPQKEIYEKTIWLKDDKSIKAVFGDNTLWREVAKQKSIPIRIDWYKHLKDNYHKKRYYNIVNTGYIKKRKRKKIPFDKWKDYLKTNPNIKETAIFENYSESDIPRQQEAYYYEWKENGSIIGYLGYGVKKGQVFFEVYKDKTHLLDEIAEFLEVSIIKY